MSTPTAAPPVPTPRRSRRRWVLLGAFAALLVAMPFLYLAFAGWQRDRELNAIYREIDAEEPSWRWADLIKQLPPAPPDERNAMVQVQKVSVLLKATPFSDPFKGKLPGPSNARLKDADEQRLRAALAAVAPEVLAEARRLKDMPDSRLSVDPALHPMDVDFDFIAMVNVARILHHESIMNAHEGKMEEATDACLALVRTAHAVDDFPGLLAQLIRTAGQQFAVDAIERTLGQNSPDDQRLDALQRALTIEAAHKSIFHALRGERAYAHEIYLAQRDGRISADKVIKDMGLQGRPQGHFYSLFPNIMLRGYPEQLRTQTEWVRASQRKDEAQAEAFLKVNTSQLNMNNPMTNWMVRIHHQLNDEHQTKQARLRCAVVGIAAERYRLKYDHWPVNLAALQSAGLMVEVPNDPFNGQLLLSRRSDTGFTVYSVGKDKTDNLGKLHRDGNAAPGADTGFELWHPTYRAVAAPAEVEAWKK